MGGAAAAAEGKGALNALDMGGSSCGFDRARTRPAKIISPTHKRTEGRAPVWGSEFTSKDTAVQGGSEKLLLG